MSEPGHPPQTLTQAGSRVAEGLLFGFAGAPALLLILVIDCAAMFAAAYFLLRQEDYRHLERVEIVTLLQACIVPHSRIVESPPLQ
jgi:hypothetical protein